MLAKSTLKNSPRFVSKTLFAVTTLLGLSMSFVESAAAQTVNYTGVATTTIQYPDVYMQSLLQKTVKTAVVCQLSNPLPGETNPFNLYIYEPTAQGGSQDGAVAVVSAASTYNGLRVQFWQLKRTSNTQFQGQLTDPGDQYAFALNEVVYPLLLPPSNTEYGTQVYAMGKGTQLVGAFSTNSNQLHVQVGGTTTDGYHKFLSDISCSR